jgi:hypothetical protein
MQKANDHSGLRTVSPLSPVSPLVFGEGTAGALPANLPFGMGRQFELLHSEHLGPTFAAETSFQVGAKPPVCIRQHLPGGSSSYRPDCVISSAMIATWLAGLYLAWSGRWFTAPCFSRKLWRARTADPFLGLSLQPIDAGQRRPVTQSATGCP